MRTILRFSCLALVATGLITSVALAGKVGGDSAKPQNGSMHVEDKAGVFTSGGIDAATSHFDSVTFKSRTHFSIVTRSGVPELKKAEFEATKGTDKAKLNLLFKEWAMELAKEHRESGVFVLIYIRGEKYFVKAIVDRAQDVYRSFTDADCTALEKKMFAAIDAAHKQTGDEAKKTCDSGLMDSTNYVVDQLKDTSLPEAKLHSSEEQHAKSTGMSILGWVCIIGVVLLGVWIVIALIRMMTGSVNGYGGGYGGYGGGGGGMGFFGGMMGGMFGAMAGMYLYDQFTGGHHYQDNYGGDNSGGDNSGGAGTQDVGEGDWDGGGSGDGAGNWGDSGADTGGGGDWGGGGGDTGGGGDWGGGGGDFGGGGGDW